MSRRSPKWRRPVSKPAVSVPMPSQVSTVVQTTSDALRADMERIAQEQTLRILGLQTTGSF